MFKKTLFAFLLACSLIVPNASKASDDNLYRNDEYHFRLKFPAGWEIKDGDGEHVVKKAVKDGSTVLVLVRDFLSFLPDNERNALSDKDRQAFESLELNDYPDKDVEDFSREMLSGLLEAFPGSKTLEKEVRYIDNRKAIYLKINQVYNVQDEQVGGVSMNYFTIHRGKLYQIGGFYPTTPIKEKDKESIINASLMTFVFEDWSDPVSVTSTNKTTVDANAISTWTENNLVSEKKWGTLALLFVASVLFTWGLGLLIPILIRFSFLKRSLSRAMSFVVAFVVYLIQMAILIALGSESKTHTAITLVAMASYWILRLGAVKKVTDPKENQPAEDGETKASAPVRLPSLLEATLTDKEQTIIQSVLYCSKCGHEMKKTSIFCSQCGEKNEAMN